MNNISRSQELRANTGVKTVMLVDGGVSFGGSLVVAARLANHLDKSKYRPVVVSSTPLEAIRHHFSPDISLYYINRRLTYVYKKKLADKISKWPRLLRKLVIYIYSVFEYLSDLGYYRELLSIAIREKINILHGNNNLEAIWVSKKLNLPCVWHFHGFVDKQNSKYWRVVCRCAKFISISRVVTKSVVSSEIVEGKNLVTLYNPTGDIKFYNEQDKNSLRALLGIKVNDPVVGVFGRLVEWKGQLQFLDGFKILSEQNPNVQAILVGDDSEFKGFYEILRGHAKSLGLLDKVIFCGYVKNTALYYQICSVIVHCSIEPEPFGLVITEAMQNQVPLIVSNLGAGPELVKDGYNGFVVDPYSSNIMAEKINQIIGDSKLAKSFVTRSSKLVEDKMDPSLYAKKVEEIYHEASMIEIS